MNGVLVVNKPRGFTSRDVVNVVSKILKTKKVGHTGTLDPMAEGVLVLCVGNCLKLVELLTNHDKEYIASLRLGIETDTLDITGNVVREEEITSFSRDKIEEVLKSFIGDIEQEVPIYSSVKVHGKKLYEYARNGEEVELPVRSVHIYSIELLDILSYNEFRIKCKVSKGTYIRSLVRDIGHALGTCATMTELVRTKLDKFSLEDAYSIEDIEKGYFKFLSPLEVLSIPQVVVDKDMEIKIKNGQVMPKFFEEDMVFVLNENKELLAIYKKIDKGFVKPYRMF